MSWKEEDAGGRLPLALGWLNHSFNWKTTSSASSNVVGLCSRSRTYYAVNCVVTYANQNHKCHWRWRIHWRFASSMLAAALSSYKVVSKSFWPYSILHWVCSLERQKQISRIKSPQATRACWLFWCAGFRVILLCLNDVMAVSTLPS